MHDRLVLTDDLPEGLVGFSGVSVIECIFEITEAPASFRYVGAGVFCAAELLHYALALVPESGVKLPRMTVLVQPFSEEFEITTIITDRLGFHAITKVGGLNQRVKRDFQGSFKDYCLLC
jgi:hypothetical protein